MVHLILSLSMQEARKLWTFTWCTSGPSGSVVAWPAGILFLVPPPALPRHSWSAACWHLCNIYSLHEITYIKFSRTICRFSTAALIEEKVCIVHRFRSLGICETSSHWHSYFSIFSYSKNKKKITHCIILDMQTFFWSVLDTDFCLHSLSTGTEWPLTLRSTSVHSVLERVLLFSSTATSEPWSTNCRMSDSRSGMMLNSLGIRWR